MEQAQTDQKPVYEPPAVAEVAEYSELTTGCGFDFFEFPAQQTVC
ncbi:lasso RiPP family leader peptide-containing protein [Streptomyces tailanensis]|nr:lasso RiPP family leader peptide-containing protein [Streptomyces tailanensis]